MSNQGQGLLSHVYPGFVCFVLILDQISDERLQDHWSSCFASEEHKNIDYGLVKK